MCRLLLWVIVALCLNLSAACNKPKPGVPLFADDFSSGLDNWIPTNTATVSLDMNAGSPKPPSLLIDDAGGTPAAANLNVSPFPSKNGLQIYINAALPADVETAQGGIPDDNSIIEITYNGYAVAGVQFVRWGEGADSGTRITYWINNRSYTARENIGWGIITGEFIEFMFQVSPGGDALWQSGGVTKFSMTSGPYWPFDTARTLGIRLLGARGSGALLPMHYDDIAVYEKN